MIPVTLEQATFEVVVSRISSFQPTTNPEAYPIHVAADLIDFAVLGLEVFVADHNETRINDNQYGVNVLGALPVRCAQVSRSTTPDHYLRAFRDPRTFSFTLGLLAKAGHGLAERDENQYAIAVEFLFSKPASRLLHLEQDGSFFSLQPNHRERLEAIQPDKICSYRRYMHATSIAFAERMADLGIIRAILGKGL